MTTNTKPVAAQPNSAVDGPVGEFPEYPPRDDMQNAIYLHKPSHQTALSRHLAPRTPLSYSAKCLWVGTRSIPPAC